MKAFTRLTRILILFLFVLCVFKVSVDLNLLHLNKRDERDYTSSNISKSTLVLDHSSLEEFDSSQQHRKRLLNNACKANISQYTKTGSSYDIREFFLINKKYGLTYCKIQKAGSSFIRDLLIQLNNRKHEDIILLRRLGIQNTAHVYSLIRNSFKFMFVRDPYERLFSGYVDKLFSANEEYWKFGQITIRRNVNKYYQENITSKCGEDITFRDTVRYVIIAESHPNIGRDSHFTPMYDHCSPCHIDFDFIGKVETMKDDVTSLFNMWNRLYDVNLKYRKVQRVGMNLRLKRQYGRLFNRKTELKSCVEFHYVLKREWRALQIAGIIPVNIPMPITVHQADNITINEVVNIVLKLYEKHNGDESLKRQRHEALLEAYSTVPMEDLIKLREIFTPDCQLFGYNPSPEYIFNRTVNQKLNLSYFDIN